MELSFGSGGWCGTQCIVSANAARGVYNRFHNTDSLSKFDHQRHPPVGVEIPHGPRKGLSVPSTSAWAQHDCSLPLTISFKRLLEGGL